MRKQKPDYLLSGHKCVKIASAVMEKGRDVWLGHLIEPFTAFPIETHCIHIKTPLKEVVLGVNISDVPWLSVFAQILNGMPVNQAWLKSMEELFRAKEVA